tara:strand:- start:289 stop:486 length:198 start_codon:yes stop_codon:yes gene_type:complete
MSNLINDQFLDNISDDVCALYDNKGVWGVIDAIQKEFGSDKVLYSKYDDDHIDTLIKLRFDSYCI